MELKLLERVSFGGLDVAEEGKKRERERQTERH